MSHAVFIFPLRFVREQVIFVPCGHQVCCQKCGTDNIGKDCPICRKKVDQAIKFFLG